MNDGRVVLEPSDDGRLDKISLPVVQHPPAELDGAALGLNVLQRLLEAGDALGNTRLM